MTPLANETLDRAIAEGWAAILAARPVPATPAHAAATSSQIAVSHHPVMVEPIPGHRRGKAGIRKNAKRPRRNAHGELRVGFKVRPWLLIPDPAAILAALAERGATP